MDYGLWTVYGPSYKGQPMVFRPSVNYAFELSGDFKFISESTIRHKLQRQGCTENIIIMQGVLLQITPLSNSRNFLAALENFPEFYQGLVRVRVS